MNKRVPVWLNRLRKREKALTLAGAVIVFVTFIINDRLRGSLKVEMDAFHEAENSFAVGMRQDLILGTLHGISRQVDKNGELAQQIFRLEEFQEDLLSHVIMIEDILEGVPDKQCQRELDEIDSKLRSFDDEDHNYLDGYAILNKYSTKLSEITNSLMKLESDKLQAEERAYKIWTWVSYALYTVGWGLGLITKIPGGSEE
jgi:hypothetical protein